MGTVHVENLVDIPGARIAAVCDIRPEHARRASDIITGKGFPTPKLYTRGERDFERMCTEEQLDLVYNATPWEWHVPIALAAMRNGKHTASEVPFAMTIDDCWALVEPQKPSAGTAS
jgi:predicted dehydrogenase